MITIKVTCDRCGKDITSDDEQKWSLRVQYSCNKPCAQKTTKEVQWCRECLEQTGLVPVVDKPPIPEEKKMSLEDMIKEIVREIIEENE